MQSPDDINLKWLLTLRWGAIAGQIVLLVAAMGLLDLQVPWGPVSGLLVIEAATNLIARRNLMPASTALRVLMVLDVVLFSLLLALTGGPNNPFNFLSLVYIALAAVVLPSRWAWSLAALSFAGYGVLFLVTPQVNHVHLMSMHLQGMWVAFGVAALFIVYFVHRVTRALAEREAQLQRAHRLTSLATLAAGAAHELSTPLSTIAIIAKDLKVGPGAEADVQLIRQQVARCAELLRQMAADVGASQGERPMVMPLSTLFDTATHELPDAARVKWVASAPGEIQGPPRALAQALRALVRNALQASTAPVEVRFHSRETEGVIEVIDSGQGMTAETLRRAGEPFFSTKEPGAGTGLGLFLTRTIIEQLNGRLELDSTPSQGTRARLILPAAALHPVAT